MKKIYLTLLLTIISGYSLFAQNPVIQDPVQPLKYDFPQFGRETVDFIKSPGKWDGGDWLRIGLISAGTVLLVETADKPIRSLALDHPGYAKSVPIEFGRVWGEIY